MPGKVFISCGQREKDGDGSKQNEKNIAEKIKDDLKSLGFNPYLSFKVQSTKDIMTIIEELKSSDYYLFIDFERKIIKDKNMNQLSIFTHQELAIAHSVKFDNTNTIAFKQKGIILEGFAKHILLNQNEFENEKDLRPKIEQLIKDNGWKNEYSRNLVIKDLIIPRPCEYCGYSDHSGVYPKQNVFQVKIENRRPDIAAERSVCILDEIKDSKGKSNKSPDRSYLKWAGQKGYDRTILPEDFGIVDLFAINADQPGIFLHSLADIIPREPIIKEVGVYSLIFKIFAQGFPLENFTVKVDYQNTCKSIIKNIIFRTTAELS